MKLDLHVHTKEVSPCGLVSATDIVDNYIKKGFAGIVITDHFNKYFFEKGKTIDDFLLGYKIAKNEGRKKGIKVYLGMELKLNEGENEYLLYGIDEEFLRNNPNLYEYSLEETIDIIHNYGGIIIQAHPFRNQICFPRNEVDGYEVFNGHFSHRNYNEKALSFAIDTGKIQTSGSDTHWIYDTANGGIELDKLPDETELVKCLSSNPKLIKTPEQHIKIGVLTNLKDIQTATETNDLNAIISFVPVPHNSFDIPVFYKDNTFQSYLKDNRYSILNNVECSNPFDPSISLSEFSGTTTIILGTKEDIFRENGHYTVTLPNDKFSVVEFFGYKPIIK